MKPFLLSLLAFAAIVALPIADTPAHADGPPTASAPVTSVPLAPAPGSELKTPDWAAPSVPTHAAPVVAPDLEQDPGGFLSSLIGAAKNKQWSLLVGLALIGIVWLARKMLVKIPGAIGSFFSKDRGGALLVLLCGVLSAIAAAFIAGKMSLDSLLNGVVNAVIAAGGFNLLKKIFGSSSSDPVVAPQVAVAK